MVESVKAASDIYAPVAGEVVAVNDAVADAPDSINADAYAQLAVQAQAKRRRLVDGLLDAAAYGKTTGALIALPRRLRLPARAAAAPPCTTPPIRPSTSPQSVSPIS